MESSISLVQKPFIGQERVLISLNMQPQN